MPVEPDYTKKGQLTKDDSIPMPEIGTPMVLAIGSSLTVLQVEGTKVMVEYKSVDAPAVHIVKDLAQGPFTIGRLPDNILSIEDKRISRLHATLSLVGGKIIYTHLSEVNPQPNPYFKPAAVEEDRAFTKKPTIAAGESIPMPPEGEQLINHWGGKLAFTALGQGKTRVEYLLSSGVSGGCCETDLSKTPITIGRSVDNALVVTGDELISRHHGQISEVGGKIIYTHVSTKYTQPNPYYQAHGAGVAAPAVQVKPVAVPVVQVGAIEAELGAAGAGYTQENKRPENSRTSNEDRGIASTYLALNNVTAKCALEDMITKEIGPALVTMNGGSTLSTALKTNDGKFVCANVGDSPIYAVLQNKQTGDIRLLQVDIPHSIKGGFVRQSAACQGKMHGKLGFDALAKIAMDEIMRKDPKFNDDNIPASAIMHYLGKMGGNATSATYRPDVFTVDPAVICPEDSVFRGMLVCSDGVVSAVGNGAVQAALKPLYHKNEPTPESVSKAVVEASLQHTNDNVTAMAVPPYAAAGNMITVADGNTNTAQVSEAAIAMIRQKCMNKPVAIPGPGGQGLGGQGAGGRYGN